MKPIADVASVVSFITETAPANRASWDDAPKPVPDSSLFGQPEPEPEPEFDYDQRIAW